jgi:GMP synthase-like glutamine amidotransferase
MQRVLVLQHVPDDPPAYLAELLQEHSIACEIVDVIEQSIPELAAYQALIIMGGSQHLYADRGQPYLEREIAALRPALSAGMPVLGICLGGQILAHVLGAEVRKHRQHELGFFEIPLTEAGSQDPLFTGLPGYQLAFHWHEDVFALPAGAVRLASNEAAPEQAFRYGQTIYGLQFHIELTTALAWDWFHQPESVSEIVRLLGEDAPGRLWQTWQSIASTYHQHTRILFENFLRIAQLL